MELRELLADFKALDTNGVVVSSNPRAKTAYELYNSALVSANIGKKAEARQLLRQAIQTYPDFDDGYLLLGLLIFDSGNRIDAMKVFNQISGYHNHMYAMDCFDRLSGVTMLNPVSRSEDDFSIFIKGDQDNNTPEEQPVGESNFPGGIDRPGDDYEEPAISYYGDSRQKSSGASAVKGYTQMSFFDDENLSDFFTSEDGKKPEKSSKSERKSDEKREKKSNTKLFGGKNDEDPKQLTLGFGGDDDDEEDEDKKKKNNALLLKRALIIGVCVLILIIIGSIGVYSSRDKLFKKPDEATPVPTETPIPTPTATIEPDEPLVTPPPIDEKIEEAKNNYNSLKSYYDKKDYHACVEIISSNNWDYLPEDLIISYTEIYDQSLSKFADQYYEKMYGYVNSENWTEILKYGLELIKYCPDYTKGAAVYFNVGKAYELSIKDKESAIYYYNQAISKYPGTADAGYAQYRLKLLTQG